MESRIMQIERKTDQNNIEKAWIGKMEFSKTGRTIYFNSKSFKRSKAGGISANHYDLETGDEYWLSGVKKNGQDRHWAGGGRIIIDRKIVEAYLELVDFDILDENAFELVDIVPTDNHKFAELENEKIK